jgi:hypothetical protein
MPENCPICKSILTNKIQDTYDCPRCGRFAMPDNVVSRLPYLYGMIRENDDVEVEKAAILSHAICKMQKAAKKGRFPNITEQLIKAILKNPLPNVAKQADNLVLWFAQNVPQGKRIFVQPSTHQSIVGATSPEGFGLILKKLLNRGFLDGHISATMRESDRGNLALSFDGWQYYEQLKKGAIDSRTAFMAMEYGDPELDGIVDNYFKDAVKKTGFELFRLTEKPKAGSIDDRLRVEIRNSRFLLADLTHSNAGAYWEAGYAEGLGKPVIYTCRKEIFDSEKTKPHFDTNHHLTVVWDSSNMQEAVEMLKATIRATLPDEAKLSDD